MTRTELLRSHAVARRSERLPASVDVSDDTLTGWLTLGLFVLLGAIVGLGGVLF